MIIIINECVPQKVFSFIYATSIKQTVSLYPLLSSLTSLMAVSPLLLFLIMLYLIISNGITSVNVTFVWKKFATCI